MPNIRGIHCRILSGKLEGVIYKIPQEPFLMSSIIDSGDPIVVGGVSRLLSTLGLVQKAGKTYVKAPCGTYNRVNLWQATPLLDKLKEYRNGRM